MLSVTTPAMKRTALTIFVLAVAMGAFFWPRGAAQTPAPPASMSKEDFLKWSGQARALLDGATPPCWVLVTSPQGARSITHEQVIAWSQGQGSTSASISEDDICFFCVEGNAVKQIPAWVLLDYLKDKAAAKQAPVRIMVEK